MHIDARIPVIFAAAPDLQPGDALLCDTEIAVPPGIPAVRLAPAGGPAGHPSGCLCCVPRGQVGEALGRLFQARARGEVGFFRRVVAAVADPEAVRQAVRDDRLAAAWFRLG